MGTTNPTSQYLMILLASIKVLSIAHLTKTLYSDRERRLIEVFQTEKALTTVKKHLTSIISMVKLVFLLRFGPILQIISIYRKTVEVSFCSQEKQCFVETLEKFNTLGGTTIHLHCDFGTTLL